MLDVFVISFNGLTASQNTSGKQNSATMPVVLRISHCRRGEFIIAQRINGRRKGRYCCLLRSASLTLAVLSEGEDRLGVCDHKPTYSG